MYTPGLFAGEGQGSKDVSDQIENEDMLDTATDGKEKPEEERNDVAEEDNGIEMSDDFDSHLQVPTEIFTLFFLRGSYMNGNTGDFLRWYRYSERQNWIV